jgi:predicted RNase H-like nuclease
MRFIGLDLAWTPHRESGFCVIEGDRRGLTLRTLDTKVFSTVELLSLINATGDPFVAAVDAPLIIGDARRAEADLNRAFGRFKASAYSPRPAFLARMNGLAGPQLAKALDRAGVSLEPAAVGSRAAAIEVYPHAAHVQFFHLRERLPYKKGPLAKRRDALATYQDLLGVLLREHLPALRDTPAVDALLGQRLDVLGGRALKATEDALDALTCAYVAYHCWLYREDGFTVFGDDRGSIIVPRWPGEPVPWDRDGR